MRISDELLQVMLDNSFKNFHVKGFDYLCLKRTPGHTRKVYFFDGNVSHLPDVVNPHDHRYQFTTTILCGHMSNSHYEYSDEGETYQQFSYRTPLNGGDGFTWEKEVKLRETKRHFYIPGERYIMGHAQFHTIRMHKEGTIIMLDQYRDVVPIDQPTIIFMGDKKAPDLNGLYERFTADEVLKKYSLVKPLLDKYGDW
jgi:hypothetical protein